MRMAGPLEIRSGAFISPAMIIARVVLPRPGGRSKTWSGLPAVRAASNQTELLADPRLPLELGQAVGRSIDSAALSSGSA